MRAIPWIGAGVAAIGAILGLCMNDLPVAIWAFAAATWALSLAVRQ